ncbi:MAG: hypothetical protein R6W93_00145 [Candidatus Limnocylindrales bacterium]
MNHRILSFAVTASLLALALPGSVSAAAPTCPPGWSPVGASVITDASVGNTGGAGGTYCARYHTKLSARHGVDVWVVGAPFDLGL